IGSSRPGRRSLAAGITACLRKENMIHLGFEQGRTARSSRSFCHYSDSARTHTGKATPSILYRCRCGNPGIDSAAELAPHFKTMASFFCPPGQSTIADPSGPPFQEGTYHAGYAEEHPA